MVLKIAFGPLFTLGGAMTISSVQRVIGRILAGNTSATITIPTPINLATTFLSIAAIDSVNSVSANLVEQGVVLTLTNSNTITLTRSGGATAAQSGNYYIDVIQLSTAAARSIQTVTNTSSAFTPVYTINAVNPNKSLIFPQGATFTGSPSGLTAIGLNANFLVFASPTTVQMDASSYSGGTGSMTGKITVVEFY
jgi:hypothetical protein